jgi:transposase
VFPVNRFEFGYLGAFMMPG